jgi:hypothetical protein
MMEEAIVWKYDPSMFSYLREGIYSTTQRRGPIRGYRATSGEHIACIENARRTAERLHKDNSEQELVLIVGFANVTRESGEVYSSLVAYDRRYWWLKTHDRDLLPNGVYRRGTPSEAVKPMSIKINQESERF